MNWGPGIPWKKVPEITSPDSSMMHNSLKRADQRKGSCSFCKISRNTIPLAVQQTLWTILPNERYVANPIKGSRHNRASSVDLTLVDSEGRELQMPTGFDDFSPRAHHHYQDLPDQAIRNRELLKGLMVKAGFIPLPEEWWHYDDEKWMQFDIIDMPFQDLLRRQN